MTEAIAGHTVVVGLDLSRASMTLSRQPNKDSVSVTVNAISKGLSFFANMDGLNELDCAAL
jgi:hypothetical protein